jgi:3-ketosteroid 9alpha-monooxygenase subunit B
MLDPRCSPMLLSGGSPLDINDKYLIMLLSMSEDTEANVTIVETERTESVVIDLYGNKTTADYRSGNTLLQTARMAGLSAPSSCETGSCGTCMARIVAGSARMLNNDALDDDEVAEGWVLTCQSLPTSQTVHVVYE